mgnify:CR=1 FL=1
MVKLKRLNPNDSIKPFDCGDTDLNGFLLEDDSSVSNARHHTNELLAVTYIIEDEDKEQTIAYFSLLNDKIEREITDNAAWNRLSREIPNIKRRKTQPAVKIGRLAVSKEYQGQGYATEAVKAVTEWALQKNNVTAIEAETDVNNIISQKVLAKCGFIANGVVGEEGPRFVLTRG